MIQITHIISTALLPIESTSGLCLHSYVSWTALTGVALVAAALLIYRLQARKREKETLRQLQRTNDRLALVLRTGNVNIWTYRTADHIFTWIGRDGLSTYDYTETEFSVRYRSEEFARLMNALQQIADQKYEKLTLDIQAKDNAADTTEHDFIITLAVLRRDQKGCPTVIMGTKNDVTEERRKKRQSKDTMLRYRSVFHTAMVDMVYFDENGNIANLNDRACRTFHLDHDQAISSHINVRNIFEVPDLDLNNSEYFHATIPFKLRDNKFLTEAQQNMGCMFYELQLAPVFDISHRLLGIYGSGREVTEVADAYRRVQKSITSTQQANKEVTDYVRNIDYMMKMGGVRMVNYSPDTHTLSVYSESNHVQLSLTQTRALALIDEESKRATSRIFNSMDNRTQNSLSVDAKTLMPARLGRKGLKLYLQFHFIPTYDEQGHVKGYFGMCRDSSEMKATEQLLAEETVKAQKVETAKNAFLRNMSYEIRTPLNTVVGFAELFEREHTAEDEQIFVKQIKENSTHLLKLINEILFLSRLDAQMIDINKQPTDFAKTFEGHCQVGWTACSHEGVSYEIENPYDELVVDIDDQNLGIVIEQVATNAAMHTKAGTVHARYDYINDTLIITIDDTGEGISPTDLNRIFERFVTGPHSGTGLGLPICQELVTQMGGNIKVKSEQGKGTTVWIFIPCQATVINRKK